MKIYIKPYFVRIGLLLFAFLIAFVSLYYTNQLVVKLGEREQKLIDLYAKGLESAATADNDANLSFLFQEIIQANTSVPVILADQDGNPLSHKNLEIDSSYNKEQEQNFLKEQMKEMAAIYQPIPIEFTPGLKNFIYYKNSYLLTQLRYYPFIQLTVIFVFILLGYLVLNNSRRAEQNRVWVGMAKETAHQLGTPLSSLMAWTELFKDDPTFSHPEFVVELEKDVKRLETITARFSNIGSLPSLKKEDLGMVVHEAVQYLSQRVSGKVEFEFEDLLHHPFKVNINKALFDWALENIIKNGVDAMSGKGKLTVTVFAADKDKLAIDISDTGKGIPKNKIKTIFNPGYTTKQRGWGLGLTLTKRIIENYHKGKVFVKTSELGKGTTFRILIDKA